MTDQERIKKLRAALARVRTAALNWHTENGLTWMLVELANEVLKETS